jgi:hypothetical protein
MKVSDILRAKGSTLYTLRPEQTVWAAVQTMAVHDIGSVVVACPLSAGAGRSDPSRGHLLLRRR